MSFGDRWNKPPFWAFEPGLVDPEWAWAHGNLLMSLPFWDLSGNDIARPKNVISIDAGSPSILAHRRGICVDFDGSSTLSHPKININTNEMSMAVVFEADSFGTGADQDVITRQNNSNTDGYVFEVADSKLEARMNVSGALGSANNLTTGVTYAAIFTSEDVSTGTDLEKLIYLGSDGSFESVSRTFTRTFDNGPDPTSWIGSRNTAADSLDGRIYCVNIWDKWLSEGQMRQWVHDPFGMFRQVDRVIWRVPTAVAVPTIHLTMPPYIPALR